MLKPSLRRRPRRLIGAIGCSGGTGDQDAAVCKVGAEALK
ncbi:MAG: heme-binding protein [Xanthobacteraceae bacterium]|nr:heme-binding protein [Xanthobacteraceae bacterium]